ncbi:MAG: patatin family protein [Ruminococcaceae bacterium]|nr:patatin family protein [Oscillospiraceae bacterium]
MEKKKTGLILEGGAMRGLFTSGVCDVMMENSIEFDGIIGVSAGAAFGCNYKSRQPGRVIRYNKKYSKDPRFCSLRSLIKTGDMYGANFCYEEIPQKLDPFDTKTFTENETEFWTVSTDVETGKALYHKCTDGLGNDLLWIRAGASLPLVSRIVEAEGYKMLDGGIADSIPLRFFESIGYEKNVVILTRERGYKKEKASFMGIMRMALRKYPNMISAVERRHEMYNETLEYIEKREREGAILVLSPDEALPIARTEKDPEKLQKVYDMGRTVGEKRLSDIMSFIADR